MFFTTQLVEGQRLAYPVIVVRTPVDSWINAAWRSIRPRAFSPREQMRQKSSIRPVVAVSYSAGTARATATHLPWPGRSPPPGRCYSGTADVGHHRKSPPDTFLPRQAAALPPAPADALPSRHGPAGSSHRFLVSPTAARPPTSIPVGRKEQRPPNVSPRCSVGISNRAAFIQATVSSGCHRLRCPAAVGHLFTSSPTAGLTKPAPRRGPRALAVHACAEFRRFQAFAVQPRHDPRPRARRFEAADGEKARQAGRPSRCGKPRCRLVAG